MRGTTTVAAVLSSPTLDTGGALQRPCDGQELSIHSFTLTWVLRKTKSDELPQLINILRGEMSFVGLRPEVRRDVERFREDYVDIPKVLAGITDLASLKYRNEVELLGRSVNPEEEYAKRVLPENSS